MKENYQKPLKTTLFFLSNPVSFNGQSYQKQKRPGSSDMWLSRLWNKFTKISSLVIYYLTKFDGVIQSSFWVIPNIAHWNLCKPIHDIMTSWIIHELSFVLLNLESVESKRKNYKNLNISRKKSFLDEIKNIFHSFWELSRGEKMKNWWKIVDTSFKYICV